MGKRRTSSADEQFMSMACRLALRGRGKTRPNPLVGSVLVRDGRIVGKGYHEKHGAPHAEVVAIQDAQEDPRGCTLYVNLEPCAHFGRTPPCVDLILAKSIGRIVIGTQDPNPMVNGRSIRILQDRGIEVVCGILEPECRRLNEVFFKYIETGKPFVTLKAAMSLDGKIAAHTGISKWISCAASRKRVHRFRAEVDAILVGIGTVLKDNPALTVRGVRGASNPLRVIVDSRLRIPLDAKVLEPDAPTMLATTQAAPGEKMLELQQRGIAVEVFPPDRDGRVPLGSLLQRLASREIQHVLVEGGSRIHTTALEEKEADRLMLFVAPMLLGGEGAPGFFAGRGLESPVSAYPVLDLRVRKSGEDILVEGYLKRP